MPMPKFRTGATESASSAVQADAPKTVRVNKFGARCVNCDGWVPEGEGRLEKVGSSWQVSHIPPCPVTQESPAPTGVDYRQTIVNGQVVFDGTYTVLVPVSETDHRTFKLRTQDMDEEFMPGKQIVSVLRGRDNDSDYQRIGHVDETGQVRVWRKHQDTDYAKDLLEAWNFFNSPSEVLKSVACYRCGRTLTVPASVYNGLGPECAKKMGA